MAMKLRTVVPAMGLAVAAVGVAAQQAGAAPVAPGAASAAHPMQSSNSVGYRSVFDGYRPFTEQPVVSWREANDQVGRIGGWQFYAREGQGGSVAGSVALPGSKNLSGMPVDHGGMKMQPSGNGTAPMSPATSSPGLSPAPLKVVPSRPKAPATSGVPEAATAPAATSSATPSDHSGHENP